MSDQQLSFGFYDETNEQREVVGIRVDGVDYPVGTPVDLGGFRMVLLPVDYTVARGNGRKQAKKAERECGA